MGNLVHANLTLFRKLNVRTLLFGTESAQMVSSLIEEGKDDIYAIPGPSFDEVYAPEKVPEYPYDGKPEELKSVPFMAVHTSGTSGEHYAASNLVL